MRALPGRVLPALSICLALGILGCAGDNDAKRDASAGPDSSIRQPVVEGLPSDRVEAAIEADLNAVIAEWDAGRHDSAVELFLNIARVEGAPERLRPWNLTEAEVIALPQEQRESQKFEALGRIETIRAILREINRRAHAAMDRGDLRQAEDLLAAMARFAAANRAPDVNLLCDMVARGIQEKQLDPGQKRLIAMKASSPRGK